MTISFVANSRLPTEWGEFRIHVFADSSTGKEHVALTFGDLAAAEAPLCRVHSECLTGDALFSLRCDCGAQLKEAMRRIAAEGCGLILYLRQEGRNIGLGNKIRAYALQERGVDTVDANRMLGFADDLRRYHAASAILNDFDIQSVRLMTNNPTKVEALVEEGLQVERVPVSIEPHLHNREYLHTKRLRMGHLP